MAGPKPRLTDRQAAVLAAVERLRRPVMADLWQEFPHLAPSAIKKVLDSLEGKGLVASAGDQTKAYLNGVQWWTTALTPTDDPSLAAIVEVAERDLADIPSTVDPHEGSVTSSCRWSNSSPSSPRYRAAPSSASEPASRTLRMAAGRCG